VVLTAVGKDKNCWSIAQVNDPGSTCDGTQYNKSAPNSSGACAAPAAPTAAATSGSAGSNTAGATWYTSFKSPRA
jgi:hypothetical protein